MVVGVDADAATEAGVVGARVDAVTKAGVSVDLGEGVCDKHHTSRVIVIQVNVTVNPFISFDRKLCSVGIGSCFACIGGGSRTASRRFRQKRKNPPIIVHVLF